MFPQPFGDAFDRGQSRRGRHVGSANELVDFLAVDTNFRRRAHAEPNAISADAKHSNLDAVADDHRLVQLAGEDEHGQASDNR